MGIFRKLNPLKTTYHGGGAYVDRGTSQADAQAKAKKREESGNRAQARATVMKCSEKKVKVGAKCGEPGTGVYCGKHSKLGTLLNVR